MPDPVPSLYVISALASAVAAFFWLSVGRQKGGDKFPASLADAATFTGIAMAFASFGFLLSLIARF